VNNATVNMGVKHKLLKKSSKVYPLANPTCRGAYRKTGVNEGGLRET
jgi:hypothetical protein